LFQAQARFMPPMLGRRSLFEIGKARRRLHWRPRPSADGVLQRARSLIGQGLV